MGQASEDGEIKQEEPRNESTFLSNDSVSRTMKESGNLKHRLTEVLEYGRKFLKESTQKIKEKVAVTRKTENKIPDRPRTDSKIFVTRSSIDFAKIKADGFFADQQPRAYPVIGACVIAFPYAFKQAGLPMGLILLIIVSVMVEYSEVLLIQCSILAQDTSLQSISKTLFGPTGYVVSHAVPYFYSLSVLLVYCVILADTCTKCLHHFLQVLGWEVNIHRRVVLILLTVIIIPISMTTNVKRIFKWSLISLISASFVTVTVTVRLFTLEHVPHTYNAYKFLNVNLLQSIAVMTFALSCQHTCRLYYATIDQSKEIDSSRPASIATSYSLLCTIVLGICGYLTFKGVTQGNVLENYCSEDTLATFARSFYAAFILCLFPMECQSIRHLIQQSVIVHKQFQSVFHFVITLLILIPAFLGSVCIDCLSVVLETAGFALAIPLVFILPAALYMQLSPGKTFSMKKLPCMISIMTGLTISLCGFTTTVFTANRHCIHQSTMFPYCNGSNELLGPLITLLSLNGTASFDPQILGFNISNFDSEYENLTDIAQAYFTT